MSLSLLTAYGDDSEDDEDSDAPGDASVAHTAARPHSAPALPETAAAVAAPGVEAPHSVLPSADDLLQGWEPTPAAPARPPKATNVAIPPATAKSRDGLLVPPQVSRGVANHVTEDQSHRPTPSADQKRRGGRAPETFRQKEKRKRDAGQQASGKDWVQDVRVRQKRIAIATRRYLP